MEIGDILKVNLNKKSTMDNFMAIGLCVAYSGIVNVLIQGKLEKVTLTDLIIGTVIFISIVMVMANIRYAFSGYRLRRQIFKKIRSDKEKWEKWFKIKKLIYGVLNCESYQLSCSEIGVLRKLLKNNVINVSELINILEEMQK